VAGVRDGDLGCGDDLDVRVDGDVTFVAVEPTVAGLAPVPGFGIIADTGLDKPGGISTS
jgi:hypothetical protein